MARRIHRLTAAQVRSARPGPLLADGGNLWLRVTHGAAGLNKLWLFRFGRAGRERTMSIGPLHTISLPEARERARALRQQLLDGIDPLEAKRARIAQQRTADRLAATKAVTFKQVSDEYITAHDSAWSARHTAEWTKTLKRYVYPSLGSLQLQEITVDNIVKTLRPIWEEKRSTANRLRRRIEAVLDAAKAQGLRSGDNPADWSTLKHLLAAKPKKNGNGQHFAAMDYRGLPSFLEALRKVDTVGARAIEFTVLCAARTSEVREMVWDEIQGDVWVVPALRMKSGREHRAPLGGRALEIIAEMRSMQRSDYIFPNRYGGPLGHSTMLEALRQLNTSATIHGMRSTFRDWAAECTNAANHVVEMALAHAVSDAVEAAYRRGDLFQKRRVLMEQWDRYCFPHAERKVLQMKKSR